MATEPGGAKALTSKGRQTRQRIVTAAAALIYERGVAATTIEAVQTSASVSASQLYHYFVDKDALVRAVIEHQTDTILGNQEAARLDSLEGLRAWRDMVVAVQRRQECRGGCPIGSLGSQLAETDARARTDVAAGFDRWHAALRGGLRAMHAQGRLAAEADPDALALALLASLQGGLLLTQMQRDTKPLETALDSMLALIATLGPGSSGGSVEDTGVHPMAGIPETSSGERA